MRDEQVRLVGQREPFRRWKLKARAVIKGIARKRSKARVPHQFGEEGRVDGHRRAPHIARAGAMRSNNAVVFDADSDGLCVAEAVGRRVTAGAGVVVVQTGDGVEPEQPSEIGQLTIQTMAHPGFKCRLDAARKARLAKNHCQLLIQLADAWRFSWILRRSDRREQQRNAHYDEWNYAVGTLVGHVNPPARVCLRRQQDSDRITVLLEQTIATASQDRRILPCLDGIAG